MDHDETTNIPENRKSPNHSPNRYPSTLWIWEVVGHWKVAISWFYGISCLIQRGFPKHSTMTPLSDCMWTLSPYSLSFLQCDPSSISGDVVAVWYRSWIGVLWIMIILIDITIPDDRRCHVKATEVLRKWMKSYQIQWDDTTDSKISCIDIDLLFCQWFVDWIRCCVVVRQDE